MYLSRGSDECACRTCYRAKSLSGSKKSFHLLNKMLWNPKEDTHSNIHIDFDRSYKLISSVTKEQNKHESHYHLHSWKCVSLQISKSPSQRDTFSDEQGGLWDEGMKSKSGCQRRSVTFITIFSDTPHDERLKMHINARCIQRDVQMVLILETILLHQPFMFLFILLHPVFLLDLQLWHNINIINPVLPPEYFLLSLINSPKILLSMAGKSFLLKSGSKMYPTLLLVFRICFS